MRRTHKLIAVAIVFLGLSAVPNSRAAAQKACQYPGDLSCQVNATVCTNMCNSICTNNSGNYFDENCLSCPGAGDGCCLCFVN